MIPKLKNLVANGKPLKAIHSVTNYISKTDTEIYNDLILLSGQITQNHVLFNRGLIDLDDYKLSDRQNTFKLLSVLDSIDTKKLDAEIESSVEEKVEQKTKLLFMASLPLGSNPLQLDKEYLEIRRTFKDYRHKFELTEEFDVTLDSFFESIKEENPHIIHFAGNGDNGLLEFSRIDKEMHKVPFEYLASAFKLIEGNIELIFINTCHSGLFAKVVSRFIPFAIGTKGMISDRDAISFSSGLYSALAIEKNYEKAFEFGKKLLSSESRGNCNYCLYTKGASNDDDVTPEDFYVPKVKVKNKESGISEGSTSEVVR